MQPQQPGTRFDLHLHTDRSDGRFGTEEVLERCARGGLEVVALTDHDLPAEVAPGPLQIGGRSLHLIGGAEVSGMHEGREFHLLVYFPGAVPEGFHAFCADMVRGRAIRYQTAVERLGLPIDGATPAALAGDKALTRLHLARALVDNGHVSHVGEAFTLHLGDAHGIVPPIGLSFLDAIRISRSHGGVTSWAHPSAADARRHAATFAAAGLQGLEVLRPRLPATERRTLARIARDLGLFLTGGSDWHGWTHPDDLGLFAVRGHELRGFLDALQAAA